MHDNLVTILCVGDIVGRMGRTILSKQLTKIQADHQVDITIANLENAAGGFGLTPKIYHELTQLPIQVFTSGNHIYDKKEVIGQIDRYDRLLRPHNFSPGSPGKGFLSIEFNGHKLTVINLIGRVFMGLSDCPFRAIEALLKDVDKSDIIIVDFHGEVTSEKVAMGWYLDGKVSAVFGTHTHVMTADERILDQGTAYISDIGMTGPKDGIIGMERNGVIQRFFTQMPTKFDVPKKGKAQLNGIVLKVDPKTGSAISIERIATEMQI